MAKVPNPTSSLLDTPHFNGRCASWSAFVQCACIINPVTSEVIYTSIRKATETAGFEHQTAKTDPRLERHSGMMACVTPCQNSALFKQKVESTGMYSVSVLPYKSKEVLCRSV